MQTENETHDQGVAGPSASRNSELKASNGTDEDEPTDDGDDESHSDWEEEEDDTQRNLCLLPNTALVADRYGISSRAVAALLNAYQLDTAESRDRKSVV